MCSPDSGYRPETGSCEDGSKLLVSKGDVKFLDQFTDYDVLNKALCPVELAPETKQRLCLTFTELLQNLGIKPIKTKQI